MSGESEILVNFIRTETGYAGALNPDDDLLTSGILDSFNIVSLAVFVQEKFGVEFDGEDMVRDNLASLSRLVALIREKRASADLQK